MTSRVPTIAALLIGLAVLAACGNANNAGQNVPPAQPTSAAPATQVITAASPTTAATATTAATTAATATSASTATMAATAPSAAATTTTAATAPAAASNTGGTPTEAAADTASDYEPPNCNSGSANVDCTKNGPAITQNLTGDAASGEKIFTNNCAVCHGQQGKGGVANPGSEDGVVPAINPADDMFSKTDPTKFAQQLDLFIEHGSHTTGPKQMPAWGDSGGLTPQQIADVIAYIISLNK